jgi:hypothetical protein
MTYEPRRFICVFCVHRLSASALKFFLGLQRHESGARTLRTWPHQKI